MKKVYYLVKLGLDRITPFVLLAKVRNMISQMTGNLAYTDPVPSLATVAAAADKLETAIDAHQLNPGPREKEARDSAFDKMKGLLVDLGGYVQAASNGNRDLIESAGCDVRKDPSPIGNLPAPPNVIARTTAFTDRLDVKWGGVRGRILYVLAICVGDPTVEANWSQLVQTSRNRYVAEGLTSGSTYYFRVAAIGTAGISPVSDVAKAKVA